MKIPEWVLERIRGKVPERFTGEIRINCFEGGVRDFTWHQRETPNGEQREAVTATR